MADVFQAFAILESELRQHIEQLQFKRWERTAAALGLLSPVPTNASTLHGTRHRVRIGGDY